MQSPFCSLPLLSLRTFYLPFPPPRSCPNLYPPILSQSTYNTEITHVSHSHRNPETIKAETSIYLLPRNRQLPSKRLKRPLTQRRKPAIQLLLILFLRQRNLLNDLLRRHRRRCRERYFLLRAHPHVSVFVVVYFHFDGSRECAGGGVVEVCVSPSAVPGRGSGIRFLGGGENFREGGWKGGSYQKFEGEYLFATRTMASVESDEVGKAA